MPFYEYECENCKFYSELLQKVSDPPLRKCPSCGKNAMKKLISAPVFRLKGAGWYETDFKGDKENKRNLAVDKEPETVSEAKPAKAADAKATDAKPAESKPVETKASAEGSSKESSSASRGNSGTSRASSSRASAASKSRAKAPVKAKAKAATRRKSR